MEKLKEKIQSKSTNIAILGLGYVGLPLAIEFGKSGFNIIGIDINTDRVQNIKNGVSYIEDVETKDLKKLVDKGIINADSDYRKIELADVIIICVPTPLRKTREPDISYILSATEQVKKYLREGQLIVLESTTYPGTTDEIILTELEKTGLKENEDFYLAFSPERVDPGNKKYKTFNVPKVIGGVSSNATELAKLLYENIVSEIVPVSSSRTAEMVKLYENVFRNVNIALANEITLMCDKMGIDVWEVIEAAKTKPFGFMPFYPGPGIGGHCITTDPTFLSWKAKAHGFEARLVELATQLNNYMPQFVVNKTQDALNKKGKAIKSSDVLILGIAYKKDISDARETPALDVIQLLKEKQANVSYHDPYIGEIKTDGIDLKSREITEEVLSNFDCVIIVTDHTKINYDMIVNHSDLIIDTRNVIKKKSENIVKL